MAPPENFKNRLFQISSDLEFNDLALGLFRFQHENNRIYREFTNLIGKSPGKVTEFTAIPFLPISFFRDQDVICNEGRTITKVFTSSATTGSIPSRHSVHDLSLYEESFIRCFSLFYGKPEDFRFLVMLPGYMERQGSSLIYMMDEMVRRSNQNGSGFLLDDFHSLEKELQLHPVPGIRTILFGASYALLDFAEYYTSGPVNAIVMETGGMKGRKKEMIREELHDFLCRKLGVEVVHSEYGMTELLSQAYSRGKGIFRPPPWMKVLIRDVNDPFEILPTGKTGGINIIDLANIYSCAFIATQDLGRLHPDGSFEVLGRFDDSDSRGCNLLVV
jgi:hypothetical protein